MYPNQRERGSSWVQYTNLKICIFAIKKSGLFNLLGEAVYVVLGYFMGSFLLLKISPTYFHLNDISRSKWDRRKRGGGRKKDDGGYFARKRKWLGTAKGEEEEASALGGFSLLMALHIYYCMACHPIILLVFSQRSPETEPHSTKRTRKQDENIIWRESQKNNITKAATNYDHHHHRDHDVNATQFVILQKMFERLTWREKQMKLMIHK